MLRLFADLLTVGSRMVILILDLGSRMLSPLRFRLRLPVRRFSRPLPCLPLPDPPVHLLQVALLEVSLFLVEMPARSTIPPTRPFLSLEDLPTLPLHPRPSRRLSILRADTRRDRDRMPVVLRLRVDLARVRVSELGWLLVKGIVSVRSVKVREV